MKNARIFQTINVISISFAHFLHDVFSSFLAPVLPLLINKLGISYSLAGLLTVFQRLPSAFNPFIGLIVDKAYMRYFIIVSPCVTIVSMSLLGITENYIVLCVLLLIMGISSAFFHVPGPVMIKYVSGERLGKAMSFYMLGGELARTIGPLIIVGAISLWGLEGTYKLIPFGLTACLVIYLKVKKIPVYTDNNNNKKLSSAGKTFIKLLNFFLILLGLLFFRAIIKSALTTFLPVYLSSKGISVYYAAISLSIIEAAGALGTFICGSLSDKIGRKQSLLIISTVTPLLMWLFITLKANFVVIIILLILMGFFLFGASPVLLALVQDVNTDRPAFVNGIYMGISFLSNSVAIMLIGVASDYFGLELSYKLSTIFAFCTIPFVLMIPEKYMK